jgi:hypothetical protein
MNKRCALAITLVMAASLVLSACGPLAELGPMGDAGEAFMTALKNGDWAASYNMLSPSLQQQLGTADEWAAAWGQAEKPVSWTFNSKSVENNTGKLEGTTNWDTGQQTKCILTLVKEGDNWKIIGYDFTQ